MEYKDILMVNSTIIGGILILLTISSFSENEFLNRSIFVIAVVVVNIFSISCISIFYDKQEQIIKKYSKMGFIALVGFMIFIGITNIINIISPDIWKKYAITNKIAFSNTTTVSNTNTK